MTYVDKVDEAAAFLQSKLTTLPAHIGIILGTGLNGFGERLQHTVTVAYQDIPHFPVSTVSSHAGKLIAGELHGQRIICLSGRFHWYEGYDMKEITFGVRVLQALGIKKLIISNAAGGTNEIFDAGDIVFIRDHVNLFPDNPLRGANHAAWGVRFPDMSEAYSSEGLRLAEAACTAHGETFHTGVYVGLPGPSLETKAEYNMVHRIGGDLVGMSTVPEAIVANHADMDVVGISMVTNACYPPERIQFTTLEDVINVANKRTPIFMDLVEHIIQHWR